MATTITIETDAGYKYQFRMDAAGTVFGRGLADEILQFDGPWTPRSESNKTVKSIAKVLRAYSGKRSAA